MLCFTISNKCFNDFPSYFEFYSFIFKTNLKISIKIVLTFILYIADKSKNSKSYNKLDLLLFKIQSIHYVKLYISLHCIQNVVLDFCALLKIMFFKGGFLIPVSTKRDHSKIM